jgi:hypothetical protein
MKGDRLYCTTCGKVFRDIETFYDTRTGKAFNQITKRFTKGMGKHFYVEECPFCRSIYTVNAEVVLEEGDKLTNLNFWNKKELYLKIKAILPMNKYIISK